MNPGQTQHPQPCGWGAPVLVMSPLLTTVHGSRLYGLAHADSDYDTYTVVPEPRDTSPQARTPRIFQEVTTAEDGTVTDATVVGLTTFLRMCGEGVAQALEAMFAPPAAVDLLAGYRRSYRASPHAMLATYSRAIQDHMDRAPASGKTVKMRRHAVRLTLNLNTGLASGRFNPVLTDPERRLVCAMAESDTFAADLNRLRPSLVS